MVNHAKMRKRFLLELHLRSCGNLEFEFNTAELGRRFGLKPEDSEVVSTQLSALGFFKQRAWEPSGLMVKITMLGIIEAEKMNQPFHKRIAEEYPLLYQSIWSLITLLVGALLLWAFGLKK
jgi:hypothetical protein